MFHRKLLPNSTSPTNLTICTDYEGCDTYVDPDTTPISLPWPPSPTPQSVSSQSSLSPYVIVVIVILACVFVFVSCSAAVMKYWGSWTFFRRRTPSARSNVSDQEEDLEYQDLDRGLMDSEIDHPIWLIRTAGLQQTLINSITVVKFKKGEYLIEGTDCSVCLSEFQDGETLRVLPKCNHAFHISCIDTWLRSHTNCPLCRAGVVSNPGRPSLASNDQSSGESRRTEVTNHVEGSEISDAVVSRSSGDGDNRNGAAAGEGFELVRLNHDLIKVDLNNLNRQNSFFNNHHDLNDEIQSVRRSNSMEHSPAAREDSSVHYSVNNIASSSESDGTAALNHRFVGSSSLAQTRPFPMKRSSSWCGRVSSARYGHASNSKLSP